MTSFIVIVLNLEFNSMRRKKREVRFNWNTLLWRELLFQTWTCFKKNVLMTFGMRTWIEISQIHGKKKTHEFTLLKGNLPKGYMWSWRRLTTIQATIRPDNLWSEVWPYIGKATQNKEKQERTNDKPKLDNVRFQMTHGKSWKFQWRRQSFIERRQRSTWDSRKL